MSLQLVANHLAQKGRGPDSTLVHMSNREVAGLQALAKKHGGQLSVNPDTGLPEAGFLDSILPAVAGAGLSYLSGGAIDPMTAGGIIGGITALDSKDLSKGLTAGLGAWGGAGMVGGLAGLGAAGADTAAMAAPEYQAAVGTGAGNFMQAPMASLSTLGGGSAIKGSLPILAGLAPVAADMYDEAPEDDGAPKQKQGYIRKYAFDPVTGQYKQVGVYEAGGDPNKDVTSEAGTAGSYGAVGQSEYEKAQGMAEGGTATDSNRIYDYLMGRGPNPMQFTHVNAPQVDYSPYMPKPITPTTPILEVQYDEYGNPIGSTQRAIQRTGGGRPAPEGPDAPFNPSPEFAKMMLDAGKRLSDTPVLAPLGMAAKVLGAGATKYGSYLSTIAERNAAAANAAANPNAGPLGVQSSRVRTALRSNEGYGPGPDGGFGPGNDGLGGITGVTGQVGVSGVTQAPGEAGRAGMGTGAPGFNAPPQTTTFNFPATPEQAASEAENRNLLSRYSAAESTLGPNAQSILSNMERMHSLVSSFPRVAPRQSDASLNAQVKQQDAANARDNEGGNSNNGGDSSGGYSNANAGNFGWTRSGGGEGGGWAAGGATHGGIADLHQYNLGSYSDGGRLLKGPGNGTSDDIPAIIGHNQPARLADGEFVVPARIVSELGNGSTDAGARELYKMMDRIQAGRKKTVGKDQVARNSKAVRHLPA